MDDPEGTEIFLFATVSRPSLEPTQFPIQLVLGLLPRPGREADLSLPCSAEIKNA